MKEFGLYNPYVILVHFIFVIAVGMLVMHPAILTITLLSAIAYSLVLFGIKEVLKRIFLILPLVLVTAVVNPLFNHSGATVLSYFPSGNPLTLEAILYGIFSGVMLSAVILWFSCFNKNFKSDKIMYVFGKVSPSLSLVISMSLKFVPEFIRRTNEVIKAQRVIGNDIEKGSLKKRAKVASGILSAITGWSMENSIETAKSMKARGYGSAKRTAFSIYSFDRRDGAFLMALTVCAVVFVCRLKTLEFSYYPYFEFEYGYFGIFAYGVICFLPVIIDFLEVRRWS